MAVGTAVLAVGLLLPFLVADPVTDAVATANPLPEILGPEGAGGGGAVAVGGAGPDATGGTLPGGAPITSGPNGVGGGVGGVGPNGGGAATGEPGTGGGAAEARTASDVGITEDTITVGIPIPDVAAFGDVEGGSSFGGVFGDPETQWRAFIDDLNDRGGINGRRVEPVFRLFDTFDPDTMLAACVYLTEEVGVFAVLGGFYGDAILCVTEQHEIPMIAMAAEGDDFYQRAGGRYFSIGASKDRALRDLVRFLHVDGGLQGRTIGILDQEGIDSIPVDRTLLPELERLGYDVAYHARIAAEGSAAQAQIPIEVQRMRSAGVDVILPATNFVVAAVFAQESEAQRYRPMYYLSDFASGATDVYVAAMPDTFEGAIGYTSFRTGEAAAGLPEAPNDAACRRTFEARSGETLDPTILAYFYTTSYCGIVQLFERATTAAGVNPTRAAFSAAMQAIGPFDVAFAGAGSFGPGKFDATDAVRRVTFRASCSCWLPIDEFRR